MNKLELFCGDTVKLKSRKRRETICSVFSDDSCQDDHIRVNHVIQNNLRVKANDIIFIHGCPHVKYGTRIHVLPIANTLKDITRNVVQQYLHQYFFDAYRPVRISDIFIVPIKTNITVEFKVIDTEPSPYCIVAPETIIDCEGEPVEREIGESSINEVDFDDIGGMEDIKEVLKEFILCSNVYDERYIRFGMAPSRGVLLYGPPGCDNLRDNNVPYGNKSSERLINQIINEIDGINYKIKLFIIGATNRPDRLDEIIFRPGRLDQTIYIPLPDETARYAILKIALRKCSLAKDVDIKLLATVLCGGSSASIIEICRRAVKAAIHQLTENEQKMEQSKQNNDSNVTDLIIKREHFEQAMAYYPRCCEALNTDIRKYEIFAHMLQSYKYGLPLGNFKFPENINNNGDASQGSITYTDDDDDLYT
ncbi:unnamed protein product [Adineta steineri]|uniref:CDC48 domain-containing protein n=1 Tax=Adineta steineri TaxID=433720 RepID=A0A813UMS2_9BILA|nr:unnamed protein product [Adineta steineri]CAF0829854.1 unnamed protein product [Adineta steineri]